MVFCILCLVGDSAFQWGALRESRCVLAIIVDHVILLHPSQPLLARRIELLGKPRIIGRVRRAARRHTIRPDTSFGVEVPKGSSER